MKYVMRSILWFLLAGIGTLHAEDLEVQVELTDGSLLQGTIDDSIALRFQTSILKASILFAQITEFGQEEGSSKIFVLLTDKTELRGGTPETKSVEVFLTSLGMKKDLSLDKVKLFRIMRPSSVPESGLVAHYTFDGNAKDQSSHENHGVVHGATLTKDGAGSEGYLFDGAKGHIKVQDSPSLNPVNAITLAAWIYPMSFNKRGNGILTKNWQYILGLNWPDGGNAQRLNFWLGTNPKRKKWKLSHGGTVPLNTWSHVAATYDGKEAKLYIDNKLVSTVGLVEAMTPSSNPLLIGQGNSRRHSQGFNGIIDDVVIYDRSLSEREIRDLYLSGRTHK